MVIAALRPPTNSDDLYLVSLSFFYGSPYVQYDLYGRWIHLHILYFYKQSVQILYTRVRILYVFCMYITDGQATNKNYKSFTLFYTVQNEFQISAIYCITRNIEENQIIHKIFRVVSRFSRFIPCYIDYLQDSVLHMLCFQLFFLTTHTYKDIITRIIV